MRGRFAPSPTGDLHLGGAYVALAAHDRVRASTGRSAYVVRMEDLDPPRVVAGAADRILDDLAWLGLDEDEGVRRQGPYGPYAQSARNDFYLRAIAPLEADGLVYPCTCSRAEIARAASAPHAGEEGPRYPGTCRDPKARKSGRPVALRLRIPDDARRIVSFEDELTGHYEEDVAKTAGDFVLRRGDGVASYQLAVVVDDAAMEIDEVVRGDDLLPSTGRQVLLARLLGVRSPRWVHLPVVRGPDGARLAKRHQSTVRGTTVRELREAGISASELLSEMRTALTRPAIPWVPPGPGWCRGIMPATAHRASFVERHGTEDVSRMRYDLRARDRLLCHRRRQAARGRRGECRLRRSRSAGSSAHRRSLPCAQAPR